MTPPEQGERDMTAAEKIADQLIAICTTEALREYANDASGAESLRQHESLVRTRLGGDYDASAWDEAMDRIRERYAGRAEKEKAWWDWHDADSSRWSGGEDPIEAERDAQERCDRWVAGESDDGPDRER